MILLIRHGETALNAARVVQPADTPLSERGIAQAGLLAARLTQLGIERVLCSDLPRARMTAEPIVERTGAAIEHIALLQERNFGVHRGTPYAELTTNIFAPDYDPPDGESIAVFQARVGQAWDAVRAAAAETRGNLAIVTHGLVCHSMVMQFFALGAHAAPTRFGNTSLTIVGKAAPFEVQLLDCTAHLEGAFADDSSGARV